MSKGTVLTTGANSGIGLFTAVEVARLGYRSIGTVRSEAKAERLLAAAAESGVTVEAVLLDVNDAHACEEVMARFQSDLYGLVNNAGYTNGGAVEDMSEEDARDQIETMVIAPMRLARLALPAMRLAGRGRIVNVSSIFGRTATPLLGWYEASKHALEAVSNALRMEVASYGVRVVLIEPGAFRTAIWEHHDESMARHEDSQYARAYQRELRIAQLAQPLMGHPKRVARVIGRALDSRLPRARYLVGYDAQALALIDRIAPTTVKDIVTRITMGL